MARDIYDGYVFLNEEILFNLNPRPLSGNIAEEVVGGDVLYVCFDLDEAESTLSDCLDRLAREVYDVGLEPDDIQLSISGIVPVPVRSLWDSGIIEEMGLVLEPFYNME